MLLSDVMTWLLFAASEILHASLSSADFFQNQVFQEIVSGIPSECRTDQARHFFGPGMGLICLQKLSADDTRRYRVIINLSKHL